MGTTKDLVRRARVEVRVVVVVRDDGTESIVVDRVDRTHSARLLAVFKVVRMAIRKDRQLKHHRGAITRRRHGQTLVVVELMRVAGATVLTRRILHLRDDVVHINVTALTSTTVGNLCVSLVGTYRITALDRSRKGHAGERKNQGGYLHRGEMRVVDIAPSTAILYVRSPLGLRRPSAHGGMRGVRTCALSSTQRRGFLFLHLKLMSAPAQVPVPPFNHK